MAKKYKAMVYTEFEVEFEDNEELDIRSQAQEAANWAIDVPWTNIYDVVVKSVTEVD